MFKLGLEKAEKPEIKLPIFAYMKKAREFKKEVWKGCLLSPCLFNVYAEHIMWNARLDELQAGIKIARRNITNLINADDTTLMAEWEEELKSLLEEGEGGQRKSQAKTQY